MAGMNKPSSDPHQPGHTLPQAPFPQETNMGSFCGKRWVGWSMAACMGDWAGVRACRAGRPRASDRRHRKDDAGKRGGDGGETIGKDVPGRPAGRSCRPIDDPILKLGGKKLLIHGGRALFPNRGVYLFLHD
jgi:hypothetical protein